MRGDGNCFYYSIPIAFSGFTAGWTPETVRSFKKLLLAHLKKPGAAKNLNQSTISKLKERLAKEGAWAQAPEVALTSEVLDLCIYVLSYNPSNKLPWFVTLFVPPKHKKAVYTEGKCPDTMSYSEEQLASALFSCPAKCGKHEPIFLLLRDQHYQPLKLKEKPPSPPHAKTEASLLQNQPLAPPAKKHASFAASPPESPAASPPKRPSTETEGFLLKYLEIVGKQLKLAQQFLKSNNIKDQELLTQYSKITEEWEKIAQKLQQSS